MTYQELIDRLWDAPAAIAHVEYRIGEIRLELKDRRQALEERKLAKAAAYRSDLAYKNLTEFIAELEADLASQEASLNKEKNLFYALRTMAELQAAQWLAGRTVGGAMNGLVTADEIGL